MNTRLDIPEGFESLFDKFNKPPPPPQRPPPDKPMIPCEGMTTAKLIECANHNAGLIQRRKKTE